MSEQKDRFHWNENDVVVLEQNSSDHRKMSEAEKAYFLKQQEKK